MPLGYQVTIFEKLPRAGRPDAHQHPRVPPARAGPRRRDRLHRRHGRGRSLQHAGRQPQGAARQRRVTTRCSSAAARRRARSSTFPGRHDTDQIFIGIDWLESIHFGHVDSVGKRVLIIGVGNTAMDCCRSAKRLGATDVKVIARKTRKYFKASPWELEDAEEEGVEILENLQPVRFIIENGTLTGMEFDKFKSVETDGRPEAGSRSAARSSRATRSCWRSGRTTRSRGSSGTSGSSSASGTCRWSTRRRSCRRGRACSSAAMRRSARRTSSGPSSTATRRRSRSTTTARAFRSPSGRAQGMTLDQHEDGPARVGLQQRLRPGAAAEDAARRPAGALREHDDRGREGLHRGADAAPRSSAASTATWRRTSPTRCASSATRASTSARSTA